MANVITNKQQLDTAKNELPVEYRNKLDLWWCRAQKPGKVFTIEYTDSEDLTSQIDAHTEKASKRSQKRQNRLNGVQSERQQQQSEADEIISELADVYGVTKNEMKKRLREHTQQKAAEAVREAESAAQQAAAKMQALRAAHPELSTEYDALKAEQQKQQERCSRLNAQNVMAQSKQKRGRRAKSDVQSVALFQ